MWPLDSMPKLFVSPRKTFESYDEFGEAKLSIGGGITLGREDTNGLASSAFPESWSNIVVDSLMNLRITNWTDSVSAANNAFDPSISLESQNGINLISGGYGPLPSDISADIGLSIGTEGTGASSEFKGIDYKLLGSSGSTGMSWNAGGFFLSTKALADAKIQLQTSEKGITRLHGGGATGQHGKPWHSPSLVQSNGRNSSLLNSINADTRPYITVVDPASRPGQDMDWNGLNRMATSLVKGYIDTGSVTYYGIGNGINIDIASGGYNTILHVSNNVADTAKGVQIGPVTGISSTWHNTYENSLDVVGRIRMRNSATSSGQVMISESSDGTAIWADSNTVGAWIEDVECSNRIVINDISQWGSSLNKNYSNYSRFDIAIETNSLSGSVADLIFANYTSYSGATHNDFSISLDYNDADQQGQLTFNSFINELYYCGQDPAGRLPGTVNLAMDGYHHIVIGDDTPGINYQTVFAYSAINASDNVALKIVGTNDNNAIGNIVPHGKVVPGSITLQTIKEIPTNATTGFQYPRIILSNNTDHTPYTNSSILDPGGWDDQISLEFLQKEKIGPGNIRFLGVRNSSTTMAVIPENGLSNTNTGLGVNSESGAYVALLSDQPGATSIYGIGGKSHLGFSVNGYEMFTDKIKMYYPCSTPDLLAGPGDSDTSGNSDYSSYYRSLVWNLKQWGDDLCPWSTAGNGSRGIGEFRFNGSMTVGSGVGNPGLNQWPTRYDSRRNAVRSNAFNQGLASGSDPFGLWWAQSDTSNSAGNIINWIGPDAEVRFVPINVDSSGSNTANGLGFISFNIPMGVIFEQAIDSLASSVPGLGAPVYGPNSSGYGTSDAARTALGDNTLEVVPIASPATWVKLQNFRIKLPNDAVKGISMFDETSPSRKFHWQLGRDPLATHDEGNRVVETLKTNFFTATCNPIQFANQGLSDNTYYPMGQNAGAWDSHSSGSKSQFGGYIKWSRPFSTTGNASLLPGGNHYSQSNYAATNFGFHPDMAADYGKHHQQQTFQWRIVQERVNDENQNPVNSTYLEFIYQTPNMGIQDQLIDQTVLPGGPSNYESYTNSLFQNIVGTEDWASGASVHQISASRESAYGMPIITPCFQREYPFSLGDNLLACQLIADTKRTSQFYESHGFALNGSAMVNFTTELSQATTSNNGNFN